MKGKELYLYTLSKLINLFFHNYLPEYTTNKNIKTNGKSL